MNQDKIWDHFQNEGCPQDNFPEARTRQMLTFVEKGSSVLNIGVGSGAFESLAIEKGVLIHSLDPSEKAIQRLARDLDMGDRAQIGYSQKIPFSDSSFDAVVMSEVLEHLDDEILADSLAEVWRVLKPTGALLLSTPYRENLVSGRVVCPSCGDVFHRWGHVQSFDKPRMREVLEKFGFEVRKLCVTTFVDWRRPGLRNFLKSIIRIFLARLGESLADPHLVAKAEKSLKK